MKINNKIPLLLSEGYGLKEIVTNGVAFYDKEILILTLSGVALQPEQNLFNYVSQKEIDDAFCYGAKNNQLEIVKYLISQGADVHARYDCALRWSAYNGDLEVVKYLVSQGADIHAENDWVLRLSIDCGNTKITKYLESLI